MGRRREMVGNGEIKRLNGEREKKIGGRKEEKIGN